jgi:hypothetical protein
MWVPFLCEVFMIEDLIKLLKNNEVCVEFTKVDGSKRNMVCTLDEDVLPKVEYEDGQGTKRHLSDEVVRVFDVEKQAWRSFRKDSVIQFYVKGSI